MMQYTLVETGELCHSAATGAALCPVGLYCELACWK